MGGCLFDRSLKAHKGHVTCVGKWKGGEQEGIRGDSGGGSSCSFLSGGQDGVLRVWDDRVRECVMAIECHASPARGTGAVSCLEVSRQQVLWDHSPSKSS